MLKRHCCTDEVASLVSLDGLGEFLVAGLPSFFEGHASSTWKRDIHKTKYIETLRTSGLSVSVGACLDIKHSLRDRFARVNGGGQAGSLF